MNNNEIIEILEENSLSEVEILKSEKDLTLVEFYYDFDKDILDGAKAYANEECEEEESTQWYNEFYLPYLYDFANDEVLEVIEEIIEECEDISGEMMAFQMTSNTASSVKFMAMFTSEDSLVSIEEVVKDFIC